MAFRSVTRTHSQRTGSERNGRTFLGCLGGLGGRMGLDSVTMVDCKAHLAWRLLFGEKGEHIPSFVTDWD